ncbi:MAG: PAS domain S-box protein [Deltaproteobacteria bacterium]|nr:PAS domain S-box protein [Deltaproteobacteria bacterium]
MKANAAEGDPLRGDAQVDKFETITGKKYQSFFQNVTEYVVAINRNFKIVMANDLFKKQFGGHPKGFCYQAWKKSDFKCRDCIVARSFQDGKSHQREETVVMKDGKKAQMLLRTTPVKMANNRVPYVLETAVDITENRNLKKELSQLTGNLEQVVSDRVSSLQQSEERYRTIFERSGDAIMLTNVKGGVLEVNQAGIDILGFSQREELLEISSVREFFKHNDDLYQFRKKLSQDGFVTGFEAPLRRKDDSVFYGLLTANVTLDATGKITGHVFIVRDVSKRKKAQEQIEWRNKWLATLNAISTAIGSSLDLNEIVHNTIEKISGILGSVSIRVYLLDKKKQALDLLASKGLSSRFVRNRSIKTRKVGQGLLGKSLIASETKVAHDLGHSKSPYAGLFAGEGIQSAIYVPLVSKGEPVGVMVITSHSTFDFSDDYLEFLSAIGNQIGVAVENAALYENLKKAYQELKEAQEQVVAQEKLASLGKLSATIAHEINNPLAAVLTYNRLMIKQNQTGRLTPERKDDIARYLSIMASETARCGEIVKNLLAFSRHSKISIENKNIEKIVDRTLTLLSHDLKMKDVKVIKHIASDIPEVQCDFKQIQQALLNVVGNASEAMDGGGVLTLSVKCSTGGRTMEIKISDTGCGIQKKHLKNIFEPFFTTKEEGKGVGLGLSVVYGIVTRHRGTIDVESEPGEGTTFTICLPLAVGH